jgi:hypothetical protein
VCMQRFQTSTCACLTLSTTTACLLSQVRPLWHPSTPHLATRPVSLDPKHDVPAPAHPLPTPHTHLAEPHLPFSTPHPLDPLPTPTHTHHRTLHTHLAEPLQDLWDVHAAPPQPPVSPSCRHDPRHHGIQVAGDVALADVGERGDVKLVGQAAAVALKQAGP